MLRPRRRRRPTRTTPPSGDLPAAARGGGQRGGRNHAHVGREDGGGSAPPGAPPAHPSREVCYNWSAMDEKTLTTLEFDKILTRLAKHTSFSAGRDLALALRPSTDYHDVLRRQRLTAEARHLHEIKPRAGLGGVHDVRALADKANLGGILEPSELLDVATTLEAGRDLKATLSRLSGPAPTGTAG